MKFCSQCGAPVTVAIPAGDNRPRHMCDACGAIHYQNPKVVAGCLPVWEEKVLLCRRAIEPRLGKWTLPAGFMENDETTAQAAVRETLEEADARVELSSLYTLFDLPHVNQVYVMYRGRLLDLDFGPGSESLDVALFTEAQIPWSEIAFPVVHETLQLFFRDRARGAFGQYTGDIVLTPDLPAGFRTRFLP